MARISGVDLPREKRVEIGLTYIYGIGRGSPTDSGLADRGRSATAHFGQWAWKDTQESS